MTHRGVFWFINYEIVARPKPTQKHTWKENIFYDVWILLPVIVTDVFIINLVKVGVHMPGEPKKILLWVFVKYSTFYGLWFSGFCSNPKSNLKAVQHHETLIVQIGPNRGQGWGPGTVWVQWELSQKVCVCVFKSAIVQLKHCKINHVLHQYSLVFFIKKILNLTIA